MTIRLTRLAAEDLETAHAHYDSVDPDLGRRFVADLDLVMERLQTFPHGAAPVEGFPGLRRARMRQFPYGVFYRPGTDDLVIVRVLHTRQDQGPTLPG